MTFPNYLPETPSRSLSFRDTGELSTSPKPYKGQGSGKVTASPSRLDLPALRPWRAGAGRSPGRFRRDWGEDPLSVPAIEIARNRPKRETDKLAPRLRADACARLPQGVEP